MNPTSSTIFYRPLQPTDVEETRILWKNHFRKDYPLFQAGGFQDLDAIFPGVFGDPMKDDLSVVAIDSGSKDIVGTLINKKVTATTFNEGFEDLYFPEWDNLTVIFKFLSYLRRQADIFTKHDFDEAVEFQILVVNPAFRRQGIGHNLVKESLKLCKTKGYPAAVAVCSSAYATKIFLKSGFHSALEISHEDWGDEEHKMNKLLDFSKISEHRSGHFMLKTF